MLVAAVHSDLQHFRGGPLEKLDGVEILGVDLAERRRRRQRAHTRLGSVQRPGRVAYARAVLGTVRLLELVPQAAEGQVVGRLLDVGVDRPQRLSVRFLGRRERRSWWR